MFKASNKFDPIIFKTKLVYDKSKLFCFIMQQRQFIRNIIPLKTNFRHAD